MSPQKVKLLVIVALLWWCLQRVPYQQVYHCCTREARSASVRCLQTGLRTRGEGYGVGGYWGEVNLASSLHWQGNESASHGFEFGRACSGTVSQRGNGLCRRASRSLADLTPRSAGASPSPGGQTRGLPRALTEHDWSCLFLYYFYLFRLLVFHCPSLIFTHCLYFMYAFGASSFYSFLYQKCTTLYHILNNYDEVCFLFSFVFLFSRRESVVSCGRIEKPHCFSCICFYRMLKRHVASSFTWAYIEIAFILVVQPLIGLTVLKKLNICTKHIRASSADMLLSHFGLVRDIICTVLSVCCMFTVYYIRIS